MQQNFLGPDQGRSSARSLEKADLDSVRATPGFPVARDEEILALSQPPEYTACPNPLIADWVREHGTPYDPETDAYHRTPFAGDVSEGKNDEIYGAHTYHTKVPHKAIMRYILHYTEPGDLVFDGFSGTGMTGVAARLCGRPDPDFQAALDDGQRIRWGARKAIVSDLSPVAAFIAYNYNTPADLTAFQREATRILGAIRQECGELFETNHLVEGQPVFGVTGKPVRGMINYVVWSDVFTCPNCAGEIIFWEMAVDPRNGALRSDMSCPHCRIELTKRNLERVWEKVYDPGLDRPWERAKQVPVRINYSVNRERFDKAPDAADLALIRSLEEKAIPYWHPVGELPGGYNTEQPKRSHGITCVHHFYTRRNLWVSAAFAHRASQVADRRLRNLLLFALTAATPRSTKLNQYKSGMKGTGTVMGTLYVPSLPIERNAIPLIEEKIKAITKANAKLTDGHTLISTNSASATGIPDNAIDFIFTDPPFGANLMYSELNFIWESWLQVRTDNRLEAIMNSAQGKGLPEYQRLIEECLREMYRVLKPGRWLTMEFNNSKNSVWNAIQEALTRAGFVVALVRTLDKQSGTLKQLTTNAAVKQDLIISAYKPGPRFTAEFEREKGGEKSVWAWFREYLGQEPLPGVKGGKLEVMMERQAPFMYERMVAYHVVNGLSIPMSTAEFYTGLVQRFPERDGMFFLPEQAVSYDQRRMAVPTVEQLTLFMSDEKSAIRWLRLQLEAQPQAYGEIQPKFLKELVRARHEQMPELLALLEQNFLKDARDRWYAPDPARQSDMDQVREKALLREFAEYQGGKGKLKFFRSEAIRAGFRAAWSARDYRTIVSVARRLPAEVLHEDPDMLMYYDNALVYLGE